MANEIKAKQGTTITWAASGGDHALTLTSLADGAGRKGVVHDFGATFYPQYRVQLKTKPGTSPTAGEPIEVYWCSSQDNSVFDAGLSSGDAAHSDEDEKYQLWHIGDLPVDDDTNSQVKSWIFWLPGRYGFPVVWNNCGQALSGTGSDHELSFTPIIDEIQ